MESELAFRFASKCNAAGKVIAIRRETRRGRLVVFAPLAPRAPRLFACIRRYVLVVFADRPACLLSHADGSGLFPEARPKNTGLSWEEIRLALMLDISSN
jgi:hypothetical protein